MATVTKTKTFQSFAGACAACKAAVAKHGDKFSYKIVRGDDGFNVIATKRT